MVFTGPYTGTCSSTWIDCNGTHSIAWGYTYVGGCTRAEVKKQKKNPFVLAGYIPEIPFTIGRTAKKKESFKKASQIVISRVGVIEK